MIKAIIFDLGGVLMTDVPLRQIAEDLAKESTLSAEEIHAHLYPTDHWNLLTLGKITEDQYWDTFLEASKISVDKDYLKNKVRSSLRPSNQTARLPEALRSNYKLAILSNHAKEWSEYMKQKFSLFKCFDQIIFSCDVGLRKPDPEIYEVTLQKLRCAASQCAFIDDKKRNTDAAEKLGMRVIVVEERSRLVEDLLRLGVRVGSKEIPDTFSS